MKQIMHLIARVTFYNGCGCHMDTALLRNDEMLETDILFVISLYSSQKKICWKNKNSIPTNN